MAQSEFEAKSPIVRGQRVTTGLRHDTYHHYPLGFYCIYSNSVQPYMIAGKSIRFHEIEAYHDTIL